MGTRLMIIELRKYNEIRELLMEKRTTGSQAQVGYRDGVREAPVTRVAVRMGVKETGMRTGCIGAYNQPLSWDLEQVCGHCGAIRKALAHYKTEIDWRKRGLGPSGPRSSS